MDKKEALSSGKSPFETEETAKMAIIGCFGSFNFLMVCITIMVCYYIRLTL